MANSVQTLMDNIEQYQYNPAAIQRSVLQLLSDLTSGAIDIVDPTNPVIFTLESAAVMTAAFMAKNEASTRKQYPVLAQTSQDLYLHMSDQDYVNRFASPAKAPFSILLNKDEVLNAMVLDPSTGIKKLVIPRNTFFTVADTVFSLQYPIEIRQLQHGGLQVVYDATIASPLQELTTNEIAWEIRTSPDADFIFFQFDTYQFDIISQTGSINAAADFKIDIPFNDQYYYCRAYYQLPNGSWKEMLTTHADQVYDPLNPTAVLQVNGNILTVRIPQIYTSTGLLNSNVRFDVYETKGVINLIMQNYPMSAYKATWMAYDTNDQTPFTAPLKSMKQIIVYSDQATTGGANGLSFAELRQRVIDNAVGAQVVPITNAQLQADTMDLGYEIVKNIDTITNRVFLATKPMPAPMNEKLITAAASSIETLTTSIAQLGQLPTVVDNVSSVTITPNTLYRMVNGVAQIVTQEEIQQLLALPADQRALQVTGGGYLYTPFHYVLDLSQDEFAVRPYYLDAPAILTKLFVTANDSTLLDVSTGGYSIARSLTGYTLQITTQSGDGFKALADTDIYVQLAFTPPGERDRAYLMGQLIGKNAAGERVYQFDLSSTLDVDLNDNLALTKFLMYTTDARITRAPLTTNFDIIYATKAVMPATWQQGAVDKVLGRFLLPASAVGVTQETLRVQFGSALHTLWSRSRSVVESILYKKYAVDVPRTYEYDIYQTDPNTGAAFTTDANGNLVYTILHHKGDPVLDANGDTVYQYRAGDTMLDAMGNPIILNPRGMLRQLDLMLIEGAYWFATDTISTTYKNQMTATLVEWLTQELTTMTGQLLEQTRLYFYPKTTMGAVTVMIKDGLVTSLEAAQSFLVSLYVDKNVYANTELRAELETVTIKTISQMLDQTTVSLSGIQSALRDLYGQDVIDVEISGLGGVANLPVVTVLDQGNRLSLRKRLVAMPDNTLAVQEDVTIDFIRHEIVS